MKGNEAFIDLKLHEKKTLIINNLKKIKMHLTKNNILTGIVILLSISNIVLLFMYSNITVKCNSYYDTLKSSTLNNEELEKYKNKLEAKNKELSNKYENLISEKNEILKKLEELQRENEYIKQKNSELVQDNIELQNSLKKAASVGIKPQNYTQFEGLTSRGDIERGTYIGKFLGTAYTPSKDECGNDKGITNSGEPIIPGISIAVDNEYWPYGTVFYIRGLGYAIAMDTGSAIKGRNRFDFAVFDKNFAYTLGSRYWDVFLVKMGDGKIDNSIINQQDLMVVHTEGN